MRVIQKFGASSPASPALLDRRTVDRLILQDEQRGAICEVTADSWMELLRAIESAPRRWFVVSDESSVFDRAQVIYLLGQEYLVQPNHERLPPEALPAIAPILLNEETLILYQGSVTHGRPPPAQSVARVYLGRSES